MSRTMKISLGVLTATLLGSAAQAGTVSSHYCVAPTPKPKPCVSCDGPRIGTSTLPPLSSYFEHQAKCEVVHKPRPPIVHPAPIPRPKPPIQPHPYPVNTNCVLVVHKTTTRCRTIVKKVHRPVVRPPVIHRPIIHKPVVHPPVIYRPRPVRVVRPIVSVPYPVPVPVTVPVYAPCPSAPCAPVRYQTRHHYSRYGG